MCSTIVIAKRNALHAHLPEHNILCWNKHLKFDTTERLTKQNASYQSIIKYLQAAQDDHTSARVHLATYTV